MFCFDDFDFIASSEFIVCEIGLLLRKIHLVLAQINFISFIYNTFFLLMSDTILKIEGDFY